MRNTDSGSNTSETTSLSSRAVSRLCPNGFSTTTRRHGFSAPSPSSVRDRPERESWRHTTGKALGGTDR